MSKFNDDYDGYIAHIKNIPDKDTRKDVMTIIKWSMTKRTIIKIAEVGLFIIAGLGIIPNFF